MQWKHSIFEELQRKIKIKKLHFDIVLNFARKPLRQKKGNKRVRRLYYPIYNTDLKMNTVFFYF